jgi:hypothetical protein
MKGKVAELKDQKKGRKGKKRGSSFPNMIEF